MKSPTHHFDLTAPGVNILILAQWALTALSGGLLALAVGIWVYSQTLEDQISSLQAQTDTLDQLNRQLAVTATAQGFDLSVTRIQHLPQEIEFAKQLGKQLGFSWTQLLSDLERAIPPNISMGSIGLNVKDSSIALRGSAGHLDDLKLFVDRLESHPSFDQVVLSQHSTKKEKRLNQSYIAFTMVVAYRPSQPVT